MTNKEAIEILWQYDVNFEPHPAEEVMHAIDMAINALTAQPETHACDCVSKTSVCEILADIYPTDGEKVVAVKEVDKAYEAIQQLPSAQTDDDRLERCKFEYVNACKILAHRTPDTRKKDIDDAYAVIKALHPIFGDVEF